MQETPSKFYYKAKQVLGKSLGILLAETNRGRTILGQGKKQMFKPGYEERSYKHYPCGDLLNKDNYQIFRF